jgi:hypothetical protein
MVTKANKATSQIGYLKHVHGRLKKLDAYHTDETNRENIAPPTPHKSESVIRLEALEKKTSASGLIRKKKVTKSNLALPGPKDGQEYGKYKAYYSILPSLEKGTLRSAVMDDWIEEDLIPITKASLYQTLQYIAEWGNSAILSVKELWQMTKSVQDQVG